MNVVQALSSPRGSEGSLEELFSLVAASDNRIARFGAQSVQESHQTALRAMQVSQEVELRITDLCQKIRTLNARVLVAESDYREVQRIGEEKISTLRFQIGLSKQSLIGSRIEIGNFQSLHTKLQESIVHRSSQFLEAERVERQLSREIIGAQEETAVVIRLAATLSTQIEEKEEIRAHREVMDETVRWVEWVDRDLRARSEPYKQAHWNWRESQASGYNSTKQYFASIRDYINRCSDPALGRSCLKNWILMDRKGFQSLREARLAYASADCFADTHKYYEEVLEHYEARLFRSDRMLERQDEGIVAARDEAEGWAEWAALEADSFETLTAFHCDSARAKENFADYSTFLRGVKGSLLEIRDHLEAKRPNLQAACLHIEKRYQEALVKQAEEPDLLSWKASVHLFYLHALKRIRSYAKIGADSLAEIKQKMEQARRDVE